MKKLVKKKITKENVKSTLKKVGDFLNRNSGTIICLAIIAIRIIGMVYAGPNGNDASANSAGDADAMWNTITGQLTKWLKRLGGMVVLVGGIMFALGWKNDDANQKTQGIQTIIAGALVVAITAVAGSFVS